MFEGALREVQVFFQRSSKDVSRKLQSYLDEFSMVFKGCCKKSFHCGSFRGVLRAFQGCFKKVLRVFQECF